MSEALIRPAPGGGYFVSDDEGNRDWYPTIRAAQAAAGPRALESE